MAGPQDHAQGMRRTEQAPVATRPPADAVGRGWRGRGGDLGVTAGQERASRKETRGLFNGNALLVFLGRPFVLTFHFEITLDLEKRWDNRRQSPRTPPPGCSASHDRRGSEVSAQRRCAASTGEQPAQVRSRPRSALQPPRGRQVTDPKATPREAPGGRRSCRGAGPGARSWAPSRSEGGRGHPSGRRSSHGTCHSRQVARPRRPFGLTRGGRRGGREVGP